MHAVQALNCDGFVLANDVIDRSMVDRLRGVFRVMETRADQHAYAMRDIFNAVPATRELLHHPSVCDLITEALGQNAFAVRGLFFDKVPGHNWPVAWHQDQVIAVRQRNETPGFGPWSVKAGAPHVRATTQVLERMVAIRLHLDDCPAENGALRCVPGSHTMGLINGGRCVSVMQEKGQVTCEVPCGGALLMKPLTLHASSPSQSPGHRRVIHIECAVDELPGELDWHERWPFAS